MVVEGPPQSPAGFCSCSILNQPDDKIRKVLNVGEGENRTDDSSEIVNGLKFSSGYFYACAV